MNLVILDRDGVINFDSECHIKSPDEWRAIPGSLEAIARLCRSGFRVMLATNQSGIGRGLFDIGTLNQIHRKMIFQAQEKGGEIDGIFFCPHIPDDKCGCRKPAPGMLLEISKRLRLPLSKVPFIGDSETDIEAAHAAGAQPILVQTGNGKITQANWLEKNVFNNIPVYADLAAFVNELLGPSARPEQEIV